MKPLFLGNTARRLYGVYHSPLRTSRHAVLLCYPGMQEYNAAHWAFRRLAAMLARDGHHVLRFDYFGTGDSAGDSRDGHPDGWVEDVKQAAQELRDLSGARELSVVGMRLGAAFATLASSAGLRVRRLVLWEPVIDGRAYVRELELWDSRRNLMLLHSSRTRDRKTELLGHPFPAAVRNATEALDLTRVGAPRADKALILAAEPRGEHEAFKAVLEKHGVATALKRVMESATNGEQEVRERALLSNTALLDMAEELRGVLSA
ncbi:MAG TPA: alpha/beta fold hydrolase [Polyangiaceae bacterium]|nr:alpha/beta fold hydrolase [Polyangiaceae bacterium]